MSNCTLIKIAHTQALWNYMYTYSQLLLRNFLFAIGFSVVSALLVQYLLSLQISEQQSQHQQSLLALDQQVEFSSNEVFARQLPKLDRYHFINITDKESSFMVNDQQNPAFFS